VLRTPACGAAPGGRAHLQAGVRPLERHVRPTGVPGPTADRARARPARAVHGGSPRPVGRLGVSRPRPRAAGRVEDQARHVEARLHPRASARAAGAPAARVRSVRPAAAGASGHRGVVLRAARVRRNQGQRPPERADHAAPPRAAARSRGRLRGGRGDERRPLPEAGARRRGRGPARDQRPDLGRGDARD